MAQARRFRQFPPPCAWRLVETETALSELLVVPAGRRLGRGWDDAWPRLLIVTRSQNEELERIEGAAHRMEDVCRTWSSGEREPRVGSRSSGRGRNGEAG